MKKLNGENQHPAGARDGNAIAPRRPIRKARPPGWEQHATADGDASGHKASRLPSLLRSESRRANRPYACRDKPESASLTRAPRRLNSVLKKLACAMTKHCATAPPVSRTPGKPHCAKLPGD